jgi:hypothetical protein
VLKGLNPVGDGSSAEGLERRASGSLFHTLMMSDHATKCDPSPGAYGQSFTTRQVKSLHLFSVVARSQPLSLPALKDGVSRGGTDDIRS